MIGDKKYQKGEFCPFRNGKCLQEQCALYVEVIGEHPNTGEPLRDSRCSQAWSTIFTLETNRRLNELGAAVESLRNEAVKESLANRAFLQSHIARSELSQGPAAALISGEKE